MAITLEAVLGARARISRMIHRTPLLQSRQLSDRLGCDLYIKAEFLQKTGSFKARGVSHFLVAGPAEADEFTTYSSGNHGQALAWGAGRRGKKAVIFMPEDASPAKIAAVKNYGGTVTFAGLTSSDRFEACRAYADRSGAVIVPPYDHELIIAGQGTVMIETLEDCPLFDAALIPVGGGGLLSGNALVLNKLRDKVGVFACEPERAADAAASLASGTLARIEYPDTIADGTRNLCLGDKTWPIIRDCVREGLTCSEALIREAMCLYAVFMKQYVEPSGAVSLACLMANHERFRGKKVVIIASGGNIALPDYARLVSQDAFQFG